MTRPSVDDLRLARVYATPDGEWARQRLPPFVAAAIAQAIARCRKFWSTTHSEECA